MTGIDRLFSGMRSSASGLTAERMRIDVISENIANARTTRTAQGGPYQRKMVLFEPLMEPSIGGAQVTSGVRASQVVPDTTTPFERILDPGHPDSDAEGYVSYPNVNTVLEMADLVSALRAYEANITAQENFMRMAERALQLMR